MLFSQVESQLPKLPTQDLIFKYFTIAKFTLLHFLYKENKNSNQIKGK